MLNERQQLSYIASQAADARLNVELETEGMTLNIGPQHPATHGTLRIIARLDGEQVVWAEPVAGYMHRGYEKLCEVRTFPQVTTLVNRIDWLGSFANEVPFILAAEQLMDIEAPPRAQYIRTILFELSRIANVGLFLGDLGVQMGAITPVFMAFRDREYVLNLIEGATGGRFHPNFDRIGGLKDDLPKGWIDETKQVMRKLRQFCDEIHPTSPSRTACRGRISGRRVSTGTFAATRACRWRGTRPTGRSGPIPTETRGLAAGCACKRPVRRPRSSTNCSTTCRPDP
jgi:NADH-quinone oxidoreductase subunit D